jgi:hypothetical protein
MWVESMGVEDFGDAVKLISRPLEPEPEVGVPVAWRRVLVPSPGFLEALAAMHDAGVIDGASGLLWVAFANIFFGHSIIKGNS